MHEEQHQTTGEFDPSRFFESFIRVGRELAVRPRQFFRSLPRGGSIRNAFIFFLMCAFLSALFMANLKQGDFSLFLFLLTANVLSAFTGTLVLHMLIARAFGSPSPMAATFKVIAYASLTDIGTWIPVAGLFVYCYGLYLLFLGLQEMHLLKPRQAGAAVAAIVLIVSLLLIGLLLMAPEELNETIKKIYSEGL
jgi:hypothetical protein